MNTNAGTFSKRSKYGKPVRQFHGMRHSSEYSSYMAMRTRCMCPNHPTYKHYGGRGITMDPRWLDFKEFYADMGDKPGKGYTIERKDTNGNYCKENCIWLLRKYQTRNQRTTKLDMNKAGEVRQKYSAGGITMRSLAEEYDTSSSNISSIIKGRTWK